MELPDVVQEESRCTLSRDNGVGSHKVRLLGREVDDVHDRVVAVGTWEFTNEIDTYNVPRCVWDGHRVQFAVWFVS